MLGTYYCAVLYDVHGRHDLDKIVRRRNRAREDAAWKGDVFANEPTFPDADGREYWDSLNADDANAPTGEVWRACVENESAVSSLPVGYDGTWRSG